MGETLLNVVDADYPNMLLVLSSMRLYTLLTALANPNLPLLTLETPLKHTPLVPLHTPKCTIMPRRYSYIP